jgi:peptidoglycan hydrolase-like protein with peptidoglycan-binding domain
MRAADVADGLPASQRREHRRAALMQFQREHKLKVDGIGGTKTRAALNEALAKLMKEKG